MTTVTTLRKPKAKRLSDDLAPQSVAEINEPLTPRERYERWRRMADEQQVRAGPSDEPPLTMEEIVAIVKEARAERYAEKRKNSNCR